MKEHTLYALKSRYTSSVKYDAKHMFSYLDFRCYFEATGQNHIHFWLIQVLKNSMTWYFLTFRPLSSKPEFVHSVSPVILWSRRENAHLLVNPIPKLTIVLIWKTPPCLKFGKTSNRAVKNLPQRKLWVWAANDARSHLEFDHTEHRGACASSETIDLCTLEFGLTSARCPSTTSERVTSLHILVPAITRGTLARPMS